MNTLNHARRALFGLGVGLGLGGCAVATHDGDANEEASASSATELLASSCECGTRYVSAELGRDVLPGKRANDCRSRRTPCATVQHGVDAACARDTVHVGPGDYVENVVIAKSLTVEGSRRAVIRPARSAPKPCDSGSLCGGEASTIVLVEASQVTLRGLTLDGDNPSLTSGVVVGTADVDARNGIVTNHDKGRFDGLVVEDVRVDNVYLRGIYASSRGTFHFRGADVRNVRGDAESVAIFNFGGAGTITDSEVSDSSDAISANHSTGTFFARNRVVRSSSGVHSDNAGDTAGSVRDHIEDNRVVDCAAGGFGAWVFVPFVAPFVARNVVERCAVGLAAFGQGAAVRTAFVENRIRVGNEAGSVGAFVTTDQLGFGAGNVSVLFLGNVLRDFETGIAVVQGTDGFVADADLTCNAIKRNAVGVVSATTLGRVFENSITRNTLGLDATLIASGSLDARHNWWGCSGGPGAPGCDGVTGSVDASAPLDAPPRCARLQNAESWGAENWADDAAPDIVPLHGATTQAERAAGRGFAVPRGGGSRSQ